MKDKSEIKKRIFALQEMVDLLEEEAVNLDDPEYASHTITANRFAIHVLKWVIE